MRRKNNKKRGYAMVTTFGLMSLLSMAAVSYISSATQTVRASNRQTLDVQTTHLCEAGVQTVLRTLWRPFKINQNFTHMTDNCTGSTPDSPHSSATGNISGVGGVGRFAAGVTAFTMPNDDTYTRLVTVRSVGWIDRDNDGNLDSSEPRKTIDVTARYQLARSAVFDYTYFVNNYGWMTGFGVNDLIVNGDMRANGDFVISGGSPTMNGSVIAAMNEKLSPAAAGLVNMAPVKWTTDTYKTNWNNVATPFRDRWRQPYDPAIHGAYGTSQYEQWRDFVFDSTASIQNNRLAGAFIADTNGARGWERTTVGATPTYNSMDPTPTEETIMPDLSDLTYYQNLSQTYSDVKATFGDGTANPGYGQGAYVDVWDATADAGVGAYVRASTNGIVSGSAVLVGSAAKPIRVHGPVTFTQDCVIKGFVAGQGTIYTGRNVHIVGNIKYSDQSLDGTVVGTVDFRGSNPTTIDNANEKRTMLGLAARGSVIMGNPSTFTASYPLQYMSPPFTKGRWDEAGNWTPPFDANQTDSTGMKRYQSVISATSINAIAEGVNQMDAVLYTNFVGGGNVGTAGGGVAFNGSIISKDEAMVVFSLPMRMNYDHRIRERNLSQTPLIDLMLPRSPTMLRSTWQDRGFQVAASGD